MASLTLALIGLAHGSQNRAFLEIDNRFDGEAAVYVDGCFQSNVEGNRTIRYNVDPGRHQVEVRRPNTGYVLASNRVHTTVGVTVSLQVNAPLTPLRIDNDGQVALRLDTGNHDVWISPGTSLTVDVPAGNLPLVASIKEPRGDFRAMERTVWVEPGQTTRETLRPNPGIIRVVNEDCETMRIRLDGVDAGELRPGQTRVLYVRPGDTVVALTDPQGHVRMKTKYEMRRGQDTRMVLAGAPPPPPRPPQVRHVKIVSR